MHFIPVIIVYVGYIVVVRLGYFSKRRGKGENKGAETVERAKTSGKV
jgi:hypothetical protein